MVIPATPVEDLAGGELEIDSGGADDAYAGLDAWELELAGEDGVMIDGRSVVRWG